MPGHYENDVPVVCLPKSATYLIRSLFIKPKQKDITVSSAALTGSQVQHQPNAADQMY